MKLVTSPYALSKGEHFVPLNGVIVHYNVSGSGPICLSPAQDGFSLMQHKESVKSMEESFTMICFHRHMSRKSGGAQNTLRYEVIDFMEDMAALRDYFNQDRISVYVLLPGSGRNHMNINETDFRIL
jgi:proline iminopeptidase